MSTVFDGDTVRVKGSFRDWAPEGSTGALVDPDGPTATVTVYNADRDTIQTGTATREGTGLYYFDWTAPSEEGTYYFEFKGLFSGVPQLARYKFTVKFKP